MMVSVSLERKGDKIASKEKTFWKLKNLKNNINIKYLQKF